MPFAVAETGAPGRGFEAARARGCRIITIDPRRTETARYADLLIQPLPGHDAALVASIAYILLRDGTFDRSFCDRWCVELDELRAAVAPFTPQSLAMRADIQVEQIERAAPVSASWQSRSQRWHLAAQAILRDGGVAFVQVACGRPMARVTCSLSLPW